MLQVFHMWQIAQISMCSCIWKASIFVSDKARQDKAPVGWEELEVTRKELYVAGEELEL